MKKLFRISITSLLVSSMLLSSCAPKPTSPSAATQSPSPSPTTSTAAAESVKPTEAASDDKGLLVSDKPIELTAHIHHSNNQVLTPDWTVTNEAARLTNVSLKGTASTLETDSTQAFNLMIASKEIPDIVGGQRNSINKYGLEGAFAPLNELIEENAPNFTAFLNENPDVRKSITASDGNIYQIPFIYSNLNAEAWFIREDWLKKVNKEIPKTVDELYEVLTAFLAEDANGNGKKDEVGYFTRVGGENNVFVGLLSLFGVSDYFHLDKDKKVELGLYTPEYKEAIKNISKWYAEGLIDKEIFTRGGKSRDILFPENNGGVIHDWIPSTSGFNVKMKDVVPGFKLVPMLPPIDSNGDQWEVSAREKVTVNGWAISSTNKYPVETIKYMDFWWSEAGRRLQTYGIEGDTYTMVNGEAQYTDKVLKSTTPINDYMRKIGGQVEQMGSLHDPSYEKFMTDEQGNIANDMYTKAGVVDKMNNKLPALSFTEEELDIYNSKFPTCKTYMLEQLQKWVFDGANIDAEFDGYMAQLKAMGIEDVIKTQQDAYDRFVK